MNAKKLPSGNWRCRAYDNATKTTKSFTAPTKKEAEFLASEWLTGRNKVPIEPKTVKQAISDYIDLKKNMLSPKTIDTYKITLERQYSDEFLASPIGKLNGVSIQAEVNRMTALFAPKTVHNAHGLLSAALKIYFPELHYNITLPKIQKRMRVLPAAEQIIPLFRGSEIEIPFLLAVWLGLRVGEILPLRTSDFSEGIIMIKSTIVTLSDGTHIEKDEAKTVESRRLLTVPEPILELVKQLPEGKITELDSRQIYGRFQKIMHNAGFYGVTFHDLRHVNASVMLMLGVPDKYAMERGGWSTTSTLKQVYQETFASERMAIDKKIDDYFSEIYKNLATELATKLGTEYEKHDNIA